MKKTKLDKADAAFRRWIKGVNRDRLRLSWSANVDCKMSFIYGWFIGFEAAQREARR